MPNTKGLKRTTPWLSWFNPLPRVEAEAGSRLMFLTRLADNTHWGTRYPSFLPLLMLRVRLFPRLLIFIFLIPPNRAYLPRQAPSFQQGSSKQRQQSERHQAPERTEFKLTPSLKVMKFMAYWRL